MEIDIFNYILRLKIDSTELVMLLALVGITTGAFYYMKRLRKDRTIKLGNYQQLKEVHGRSTVASPIVLIVKILTVVLLFLVATGSLEVASSQPVSGEDFVVVLDNSNTMLAPDYPPNRMDFTKSVVTKWVSRLPSQTNVSVLEVSGGATQIENKDKLSAIQSVDVDLSTTGRALADSVRLSTNILEKSNNTGNIILITSGADTTGGNLSEAAVRAAENNITLQIVGIKSNKQTDQIYSNLNESLKEAGLDKDLKKPNIQDERMKEVAESTGGKYLNIRNSESLEKTFESIVTESKSVKLDSSPYILSVITLLIVSEMLLYSKYGAI